jgi:hypothetical protein
MHTSTFSVHVQNLGACTFAGWALTEGQHRPKAGKKKKTREAGLFFLVSSVTFSREILLMFIAGSTYAESNASTGRHVNCPMKINISHFVLDVSSGSGLTQRSPT